MFMEYKPRGKPRLESFRDFVLLDGTTIGVFQGDRGQNPHLDILIKFQKEGGRIRTPAHIHWVIDILIKKEHNRELTLEFLKFLREMYEKVEPFRTKEQQQKCELKQTSYDKIKKFEELNEYGEFSVEFIGHLIELMMIMEKTGLDRAFVFKELMDTMIQEKDIFSIVAKAIQKNGR